MDDEAAIRTLIDRWFETSRAGDLDATLSLMTDDVVFLTAGQAPFGKRRFAEISNGMTGVTLDGSLAIEEIVVDSATAYARSRIEMTASSPAMDKPIRRAGWVLSVFRKEPDAGWVLARDANLMTAQD